MPTAKISTIAANDPTLAFVRAATSAVSTGPLAWLRMSQRMKIRIPVANAFRKPCTPFERPRMRATGRPRKMVIPATAPSATAVPWLIVCSQD